MRADESPAHFERAQEASHLKRMMYRSLEGGGNTNRFLEQGTARIRATVEASNGIRDTLGLTLEDIAACPYVCGQEVVGLDLLADARSCETRRC